jgi:hypothetical protein
VLAAVAGTLSGGAATSGCQDEQSAAPAETGALGVALGVAPGRVRGFVRDVNGRPVPGARVRSAASRRSTRAGRSGRFELRLRPGRYTILARRRGYTPQSVTATVTRKRGDRADFSLAITSPAQVGLPNSADRLILWTGCRDLVELSDADLGEWIERGVDGFVCQTGWLDRLGGPHKFTGRRKARLRGAAYRLQRRLRASAAVKRARSGQLSLYLGFYAVSGHNDRTPLVDWFDDRGWSRIVIPNVRDLASAARSLGFTGVAVDQELYPSSSDRPGATWSWSYPGNRRSERQVRGKVKQRGRQLMRALVEAYPGLELVAYDTQLPGTWAARVQEVVNARPDQYASDVRLNLWDGLSSVEGYSAIRWLDATFYKTPHIGGSWDEALRYNANSVYSLLSRSFSNWSHASARLHVSPFSWIDDGPSVFERARDPGHVAEQLEAFRKWGSGGVFANYDHERLDDFDYGPYTDSLRRASSPGTVDRRVPELAVTSAPARIAAGARVSIAGVARDDLAIRAVRWYDDRGREGVARLTWQLGGDDPSDPTGETTWSIDNLRIARGAKRITISAEDIKGLATLRTLRVSR